MANSSPLREETAVADELHDDAGERATLRTDVGPCVRVQAALLRQGEAHGLVGSVRPLEGRSGLRHVGTPGHVAVRSCGSCCTLRCSPAWRPPKRYGSNHG